MNPTHRIDLKAVVLAAGLGTRMNSSLPKVMHRVLGWPLVTYPIERALAGGAHEVAVVVGHGREHVEAFLARRYDDGGPMAVTTHVQHEMRGTADAVRSALPAFENFGGAVLILSGDVPNLPQRVVSDLIHAHSLGASPVTLLTARAEKGHAYGRIVRNDRDAVLRIVEHKDATTQERDIDEVNMGAYLVDAAFLRDGLGRIGTDNAAGEFYLTDLVAMAAEAGTPATAVVGDDIAALHGVNDRVELARAAAFARSQRNDAIMRSGVTMLDPGSVLIDMDVVVGTDVVLEPCVYLTGATRVGQGAIIEHGCRVEDADIPPGTRVPAFSRLGADKSR